MVAMHTVTMAMHTLRALVLQLVVSLTEIQLTVNLVVLAVLAATLLLAAAAATQNRYTA
jgi:hypothetical protein